MKRCDVECNIGERCTINGYGDLAMDPDMKYLINDKSEVTIIKVTKAGLIQVRGPHKELYSIPQKNLDLVL